MYLIQVLFLSLVTIISYKEEPKNKDIFISPLNIPLSLSANFGELRIDHFHSGLDIKTQGITGKEIIAAASGYVYRISISPGGFGKALYIRHPSGYSTVYGHLANFNPEIEDYVINRQYDEKSYMITLWPPRDRFIVKQGDTIAYSGNSGSSSGPHLHYEIRRADEEIPVNPLFFEFGIEDDIKPVIEKLFIYPAGSKTIINNQHKPLKTNVSGGNGNYYITSKNGISINGPAGFGFQAYDLLKNSYNKFSVYSIELKIDSIPVYDYKMDEFSFSESRYINSHIDYETFKRDNIYVERAFILPNDKLSVYRNAVNRGIFDFKDGKKHKIEIIVADIHNNKASLSFTVSSSPPSAKENQVNSGLDNCISMPYNRNNKFITKDVTVNIPSGCLYDTLLFEFKRSSGNSEIYSDIYQIHNKYTPVHKVYLLSIKPKNIPVGKESKMLIIQLQNDIIKYPLTSTWNNGYLSASPNTFGTFYIGIDTIPPRISANGNSSEKNQNGNKSLRIRINDDLSGIKSYEPLIDGKWALFEYDQKNNMLIYYFDQKRIRKGIKHSLYLKVTDNMNNMSTYESEFFW